MLRDNASIPHNSIIASGHVGIVHSNGLTISAAQFEVVRNNWGFRAGQMPIFRRYMGK